MPDLPEQSTPLNSNLALEQYHALGPAVYPGRIPPGVLEEWRGALAGAELSPDQQLQEGWMAAEHGLVLLHTWYNRPKNRKGGGSEPTPSPVLANIGAATETFKGITENADAGRLIKAQAHVAIGALPLWLARQTKFHSGLASDSLLRQTRALAEVHAHFQQTQDLSAPELAFCWSLGAMAIINGAKGNRGVQVLSLPPRFYENQDDPDGWWQMLACRFAEELEKPLRISPTGGDTLKLNVIRPTPPEGYEDPDRLLLVQACAKFAVGESLAKPEEIILQNAVKWAAGFAGKKTKPVLELPSLQPAQHKPLAEIAVTKVQAAAVRPLSLEKVTADTLLPWYREQTSGRLLTSREGQTLQELLMELNEQPTTPEDILALNRLRLECAIANPSTATLHLKAATESLKALEQRLIQEHRGGSGDIVELYETVLDIERIKMYEAILSNHPINSETRQELCESLISLLCEIHAEAKRTGNRRTRDLLAFVRPLLHSMLLMRQDQPHLAIPSLPRQLGDNEAPGWNINVWPLHDDMRVSVGELRKLRLDPTGKKLVLEGDIAVLPVPLVEQGYPWIQKLDGVNRQDNRSGRAEALLRQWQTHPFKFYQAAIQALASTNRS